MTITDADRHRLYDALVATRDSNGFAGTGVATVNPFGG